MNRDFKGIWIPREIWLNKTLSIQAKALWAEIWSLHDRESGGCYASNEYLCEFMNIKLSRLKEIMKELRDLGFLVDVSFDGRSRIIRAHMPEIEYGGQQVAGIPASSQPENRPSASRNSGSPSDNIDTIGDTILTHTPPSSEVAIAPVDEVVSSKRKKASPDFSIKVREVANQMINIIVKHCPVYRPPADLTKFLYQVAQMIETDKQDPAVLLKAFEWGVSDNEQRGDFNGWRGIICTNNKGGKVTTPAEIFRKHFSKLHSQMNSRPKRKFAAGTDLDAAMEGMEEMNKRAL